VSASGGSHVVVIALLANLAIAIFKFIAAFITGSSAMFAEAGHSLADTINQIFLLIDLRKSARPPDERHPFGYGPETYFWAFMVAISIFSMGAAFSLHEGIEKIWHRHDASAALHDPRWAYAVLIVSILLESYSFSTAMKEFKHVRAGRGIRRTLAEARDPTVLTVLFEDLAALLGLFVALAGIFVTDWTHNPMFDGIASIVVGILLGAVAIFLGTDTKSLLIGRGVSKEEDDKIREIVSANKDVVGVIHLRTLYMGPREVIAAIKVRFLRSLETRILEVRINEIEASLRQALPHLRRIYIEPGFDESVRHEKVEAN
jgi:cation diffusion facilitator family transporter